VHFHHGPRKEVSHSNIDGNTWEIWLGIWFKNTQESPINSCRVVFLIQFGFWSFYWSMNLFEQNRGVRCASSLVICLARWKSKTLAIKKSSWTSITTSVQGLSRTSPMLAELFYSIILFAAMIRVNCINSNPPRQSIGSTSTKVPKQQPIESNDIVPQKMSRSYSESGSRYLNSGGHSETR